MANFFPSLEEIERDQMEKHTEGEMELLYELESLDDTYDVYFQPHINLAHPDVVIEKKDCGVLIIEVKDWNLDDYHYVDDGTRHGHLTVNGENHRLTTPFEQVIGYKDELFDILSPSLCERKLMKETLAVGASKRSPVYGVVRTAVFFYGVCDDDVEELFVRSPKFSATTKRYDGYTRYWTDDDFRHITKDVEHMMRRHEEYTEQIHEEVQVLLSPSEMWREQSQPFTLTQKQAKLAEYKPGKRTRVHGSAGSGKTLVLAQKAINCYKATKMPVLILTYNITLKNYIRDKIAANTRQMPQEERRAAFHLVHFDRFLKEMLERYGLKGPTESEDANSAMDYWRRLRLEQMKILEAYSDHIEKYQTVLVDEAQDFDSEWFAFIARVIAAPNADYMVVADEKQRIYDNNNNPLDQDKMPVIAGFSGAWSKLEENHRLSSSGIRLAEAFQREFYRDKYNIDEPQQLDMFGSIDRRRYYHVDTVDAESIYSIIHDFTHEEPQISPNDVCIIAGSFRILRDIEEQFEKNGQKTMTVFEKKSVYDRLVENYGLNEARLNVSEQIRWKRMLDGDLGKIRQTKKSFFYMNPGTVKMSTIHSFKGWEIDTIVLLIDSAEVSDEIVYTAITRARKNMLVIECGNSKYGNFFEREFD